MMNVLKKKLSIFIEFFKKKNVPKTLHINVNLNFALGFEPSLLYRILNNSTFTVTNIWIKSVYIALTKKY